MTTLEMEIALMKHFDIRQNVIVPNVSYGMEGMHECDLVVLRKSNYAIEIEIKISLSDLKKDIKKKHNHEHKLLYRLFFAVPESLRADAMKIIPKGAGLLVVSETATKYYSKKRGHYKTRGYKVNQVRVGKVNKTAVKWTEVQRCKLNRLGTMRILGLKEKVFKCIKK